MLIVWTKNKEQSNKSDYATLKHLVTKTIYQTHLRIHYNWLSSLDLWPTSTWNQKYQSKASIYINGWNIDQAIVWSFIKWLITNLRPTITAKLGFIYPNKWLSPIDSIAFVISSSTNLFSMAIRAPLIRKRLKHINV